jgi:subtilisin family serine protease
MIPARSLRGATGHALAVAIAVGLFLATPGAAQPSKLDAVVRVALARLQGASPSGVGAQRFAAAGNARELDVFVLGTASRAALEGAGARVRTRLPGVCTATVPVAAIPALAALPDVTSIHGSIPLEPLLDVSVPTTGADELRGPPPDFAGLAGAGVLIGVVDTGVDYDHPDFLDATGATRFASIWDQTDFDGPAPPGFLYGTEWGRDQINSLAAAEYDIAGHGTHVLGIAAGDGSGTGGAVPAFTYVGVAPRAELVAVKTTFEATAVVDGVAYAFERAAALGKPAVVNLSLGTQLGPHDGTSPLDQALSALTGPGRILVVAAGNDRNTSIHAEVFAAGAGTDVTLKILDSQDGGGVIVNGYYEASEELQVRITSPNGSVIGPVWVGNYNSGYPGEQTPDGYVYLENGLGLTATGDRQVYIELNDSFDQDMNGVWTFSFIPVALGSANGEVDLWRVFTSRARADFEVGNQPSEELVAEPGTALEVITATSWTTRRIWTDCAGHPAVSFTPSTNPGLLSPFSSPGPTRDGRQKPDIAAPGSAIGSTRTFDVTGGCPAGLSTLLPDGMTHLIAEGTSMAAPHVAGAAALILEGFGAVTPNFVRSYLAEHAVQDGQTGGTWNRDWGHGKLSLADLLTSVPPLPGISLSLSGANPSRGPVRFRYSLPSAGRARVSVLDVRGREIAVLADREHGAGHHDAVWDGSAGSRAPAGLYFIRLRSPQGDVSRRLVLLP